jgi:hypothetical protein
MVNPRAGISLKLSVARKLADIGSKDDAVKLVRDVMDDPSVDTINKVNAAAALGELGFPDEAADILCATAASGALAMEKAPEVLSLLKKWGLTQAATLVHGTISRKRRVSSLG